MFVCCVVLLFLLLLLLYEQDSTLVGFVACAIMHVVDDVMIMVELCMRAVRGSPFIVKIYPSSQFCQEIFISTEIIIINTASSSSCSSLRLLHIILKHTILLELAVNNV